MLKNTWSIVFCALLAVCGCANRKTLMVGEDSEEQTTVLSNARRGIPSDTSTGLLSQSTARPGESTHLNGRAEHGALLRLLGMLRGAQQVPRQCTETAFFSCIDGINDKLYVQYDTLAKGTVKASVFIERKDIPALDDCLKR